MNGTTLSKRTGRIVLPAFLLFAAAVPALAEGTRIEKQLRLEPGGRLVVQSDAGSIDLTGSSSNGAHVLVTSKSDLEDRYNFEFKETPGEVRIIVTKKGHWLSNWFTWNGSGPNFEIQVPRQTTLDISTGGGHIAVEKITGDSSLDTSGGHIEVTGLKGKLKARTSGGHISLRDIDGDANIETSGGHIEVDDMKGALTSETSGGHISLKDITGDITTSTSGGHIEITGAGGRVIAETSGGTVQVGFASGNTHGGRIESSGGGITVSVDRGSNLMVDAETSGGSVKSELPISEEGERSRSSLHGSLGRGGETLKLRTSAGSILIQPNEGRGKPE
jgi:type VI protein secretion system component Hcp